MKFEILEPFGRSWTSQLIGWPIDKDIQSLIDEQGQQIPFQIIKNFQNYTSNTDADKRVYIESGLGPFENKAWQSSKDIRDFTPTNLQFFRNNDCINIDTGAMSLRIPVSGIYGKYVQGPILGLCGPDGIWRTCSEIKSKFKTVSLDTSMIDSGPLLVRVRLNYRFEDETFYSVLITVINDSDVVLMEEICSLDSDDGSVVFDLAKGFDPKRAFWAPHHTTPEKGGKLLRCDSHFEQAVWYDLDRNRNDEIAIYPTKQYDYDRCCWWGCFRDDSDDYLGIFGIRPSRWQNPEAHVMTLQSTAGVESLELIAPIRRGRREWGLHLSDKSESMPDFQNRGLPGKTHRLTIQYGQTCLDELKDLALDWDEPTNAHPCIITTADQLGNIREKVKKWPEMIQCMDAAQKSKHPDFHDPIGLYLATGKREFAEQGCQEITERLNEILDHFLEGGFNHQLLPIPIGQEFRPLAGKFDLMVNTGVWSEQERVWARRVMAFFMLKLSQPDYLPWGMGYHLGNPNFITIVDSARCYLAAACPGHPLQQVLFRRMVSEIDEQLDSQIYCGGMHLEAPNYNCAAIGILIQAAVALKNAGVCDFFTDARLKQNLLFLDRERTPTDPRYGYRTLPTIGDTHIGWTCQSHSVLFAWAAFHTRESDPVFSRKMQRAWIESGAFLMGWHEVMEGQLFALPAAWIAPALPSDDAELQTQSELFPDYGAILRTADDSYVNFKMGPIFDHYDVDEGSFHWYHKGVPLCLDFGCCYIPTNDIARFHNRVSFDKKVEFERGRIVRAQFASGLDYVCGVHCVHYLKKFMDRPGIVGFNEPIPEEFIKAEYEPLEQPVVWMREIMQVHGNDYLVIRDDVQSNIPLEWNIFCLSNRPPEIDGQSICFASNFGKNLYVYLESNSPLQITPDCFSHEGQVGMYTKRQQRKGLTYDQAPDLEKTVSLLFPAHNINCGAETQYGIHAAGSAPASMLALLLPIDEGQDMPNITVLNDRQGFMLEWPDRTDWIFSGKDLISVSDSDVRFVGRCGVISRSSETVRFRIIDGIQASCGDYEIESCPNALDLTFAKEMISGEIDSDGITVKLRCPNGRSFRHIWLDGQSEKPVLLEQGLTEAVWEISPDRLIAFRTPPGKHDVILKLRV